MKLVIDHLTRYGYDEEVKFSTQYPVSYTHLRAHET